MIYILALFIIVQFVLYTLIFAKKDYSRILHITNSSSVFNTIKLLFGFDQLNSQGVDGSPGKSEDYEPPVRKKKSSSEIADELFYLIGYAQIDRNVLRAITRFQMNIKVMSFNIQANAYGGYRANKNGERSKKISDLLISENADFMSQQEVDCISKDFEYGKLDQTYKSLYFGRPGYVDGLATFYRADRFELVSELHVHYDEEAKKYENTFEKDTLWRFLTGHVLHIMTFHDKLTDKRIQISNTHLEWDPQLDDAKYFQMYIQSKLCLQNDEIENMIIMGDYNSFPKSNPCKFWEGRIDKNLVEMKNPLILKNIVNLYNKIGKDFFNRPNKIGIKNAYRDYKEAMCRKNIGDGFPQFTNFKIDFKETLDHIFYSKALILLGLRKLPSEKQMIDNGILSCPNASFPSDHLPIGAIFCYRYNKKNI